MKIFIAKSAAQELTLEGLSGKLETLFPNGLVQAVESAKFGKSIAVNVSVVKADQCSSKIIENSPSLTRIMVHLADSSGKPLPEGSKVKVALLTRGYEQKRAGINWRDFSATLGQALFKIGKWFSDNEEALKALHNKGSWS